MSAECLKENGIEQVVGADEKFRSKKRKKYIKYEVTNINNKAKVSFICF